MNGGLVVEKEFDGQQSICSTKKMQLEQSAKMFSL